MRAWSHKKCSCVNNWKGLCLSQFGCKMRTASHVELVLNIYIISSLGLSLMTKNGTMASKIILIRD